MTAITDIKISDRVVADLLRKSIRGLAKGTLALDSCELTEDGIRLVYHRTQKLVN
jgi:hypothetical protein